MAAKRSGLTQALGLMNRSREITKSAWHVFVALRAGYVVLTLTGIGLVITGHFWAVFIVMLGGAFGIAAASRRCEACQDNLGWVRPRWFGYIVNPLARKCMKCGHPVRKPR